LLAAAQRASWRLAKFKRSRLLPRVQCVMGILHSLAPDSLLDIGSGRGAFLWPLLTTLPHLPVTAVERDIQRATDLQAVRRGGLHRLTCHRMDVAALGFCAAAFDVVTMLEVLEHVQSPELAVRETVRVARRGVIVSVPSKLDENPEHLHLITATQLEKMFLAAGVARVSTEYVLNHCIAFARK